MCNALSDLVGPVGYSGQTLKKNWRLPAKFIDGFQYKKNLRMLLSSLVLLGTVLIIFWLVSDDCSH